MSTWKTTWPKPEEYANRFTTFCVVRLAPNTDPDITVRHGPVMTIPMAYLGKYERWTNELGQRWEWCYSTEFWAMEAEGLNSKMAQANAELQKKYDELRKRNDKLKELTGNLLQSLMGANNAIAADVEAIVQHNARPA